MYKSITIRNFRVLTELQVDNLGPINLFVGRNNCGKTTILEAVFCLAGATNPGLLINTNVFRGLTQFLKEYWSAFFHNMDLGHPIEIRGLSTETPTEETLRIRPYRKDKRFRSIPQEGLVSLDLGDLAQDSGSEMIGIEMEYISSDKPPYISKFFFDEGKKDIVIEGFRPPERPGVFVGSQAPTEWKDRFHIVQKNKQIQQVIEWLQSIEPRLADLRLNAIGVIEADIGLPQLIPVHLLGGGFRNLLTIALDMLAFRGGTVLIDEIDNGMHHSVQAKVWEGIFDWAMKYGIQVFASTHSLECIHAFHLANKPGLFGGNPKVFRIEREENFRVVEMTREDISVLLENGWEMR